MFTNRSSSPNFKGLFNVLMILSLLIGGAVVVTPAYAAASWRATGGASPWKW